MRTLSTILILLSPVVAAPTLPADTSGGEDMTFAAKEFDLDSAEGGSALFGLSSHGGIGPSLLIVEFTRRADPGHVDAFLLRAGAPPEPLRLKPGNVHNGFASAGMEYGTVATNQGNGERIRTWPVEFEVDGADARVLVLWDKDVNPLRVGFVARTGVEVTLHSEARGTTSYATTSQGSGVGAHARATSVGLATVALERSFSVKGPTIVYLQYFVGDIAGEGSLDLRVDDEHRRIPLSRDVDPAAECYDYEEWYALAPASVSADVHLSYIGDGRTGVRVMFASVPPLLELEPAVIRIDHPPC